MIKYKISTSATERGISIHRDLSTARDVLKKRGKSYNIFRTEDGRNWFKVD